MPNVYYLKYPHFLLIILHLYLKIRINAPNS